MCSFLWRDSKYVATEIFFEHPYLSVARGDKYVFLALEWEIQSSFLNETEKVM